MNSDFSMSSTYSSNDDGAPILAVKHGKDWVTVTEIFKKCFWVWKTKFQRVNCEEQMFK